MNYIGKAEMAFSQADKEKKTWRVGRWGCRHQSALSKMHALPLGPGHWVARPTAMFLVAILSSVPSIDIDGACS